MKIGVTVLSRDAATLCGVRPVCLSVTFVYRIEMNELIHKFSELSANPTILVFFLYQML